MYRDLAPALDEHDRAVGAILIGQALLEQCDDAAVRLRESAEAAPPDRWRAVADVHDVYPEIWRHLDRARRVLATRGVNTASYDELRPHTRSITSGDIETERAIDPDALDHAHRAVEALKLAVPGADWDGIDTRTRGLVAAPLARPRRSRYAIAALLAGCTLAVLGWLHAMVPVHRPDPRAAMRSEIAAIRVERKVRIESLRDTLADRCDPPTAHVLVKLLVLDGRGDEARALGDRYDAHCGDDAIVDHWAHAPPLR